MYILNSNLTLFTNVGDISDARVKSLKDVFGPHFPEVERPNEGVIIFKKESKALYVDSKQITFIAKGNSEDFSVEEATNYLKQIFEILSLSPKSGVGIKFEGIENTNDNTIEKSKTHTKDAVEILGAEGVGFRFIIQKQDFAGNVFIEPYIKDNQKIFYNIELESRERVSHAQLDQLVETMFNQGTKDAEDAARTLLY
ncbi:hypothetical protein JF544_16430 [Halobacillus kuroshimensis]|uniref:Uncharacterized protein n=1 Tax=Halobacillus kuroshimensis TaxID=302481 RepID=A0ABS3DZR6_9BACI|nr:hypothetical protein [Halobacillus kuroshimensis]MBN8236846.1 hypothetical protein [Halobacillus kuroshimensis]